MTKFDGLSDDELDEMIAMMAQEVEKREALRNAPKTS